VHLLAPEKLPRGVDPREERPHAALPPHEAHRGLEAVARVGEAMERRVDLRARDDGVGRG